MWVEQAVFTSSKTRRGEGYHVVAESPGVSNEIVTALNRWCPSHASLQSGTHHEQSLSFHPLSVNTVALARTTYGLKEFSNRGGLQVVTIALVLRRDQLAGYGNNCFRLARVARSLGYMRWQPQFPERLAAIELPDEEFSEAFLSRDAGPTKPDLVEEAVLELLRLNRRVVVIAEGGSRLTENIVEQLTPEQRLCCFFSTALRWSKQRPYRVQVLRDIDQRTRIRMKMDEVNIVQPKVMSRR